MSPTSATTPSTKTLVVDFPSGFYSASYKRVWGWTAKVTMRKLATPIPCTDGDITEEVAKITWRPTSKSDWIAPGSFEEFGLSMRIPNKPNSTLYFPARQTYSGGEVVNWAGPAGSENPAPTLNVVPRMKLRALAVAATLLLVPTSVAFAHTPLKSVDAEENSTQHKAVKEVRATFKAKMQTGIIEITKAGSTVTLKSSGLISANRAVIRAVPSRPLGSGTYKVSWRARAGDGHSERAPGPSRCSL